MITICQIFDEEPTHMHNYTIDKFGITFLNWQVKIARRPTFWIGLIIVPTFLLGILILIGLFFTTSGQEIVNNAVRRDSQDRERM